MKPSTMMIMMRMLNKTASHRMSKRVKGGASQSGSSFFGL